AGLPSAPKRLAEAKVHLVGKYLVPAHSGVVSGLSAPSEKPDPLKVHDIALLKEPGDPVLVPPEGFETIGWVVGRGGTYAEAEEKRHRVTFLDKNETPLPFDKIAQADADIVFNVCERINNSSLLEPHAAAILDCLGIPYTGSNPLTLALCIDKIKVKKILEH